jgi:hypothetical protein
VPLLIKNGSNILSNLSNVPSLIRKYFLWSADSITSVSFSRTTWKYFSCFCDQFFIQRRRLTFHFVPNAKIMAIHAFLRGFIIILKKTDTK